MAATLDTAAAAAEASGGLIMQGPSYLHNADHLPASKEVEDICYQFVAKQLLPVWCKRGKWSQDQHSGRSRLMCRSYNRI
jgi:hypothetical protein